MLHFVNVLDYADAGKVDPHSPEDGSFDNLDLRHIRRFVQLDIRLRTQVKRPSATRPAGMPSPVRITLLGYFGQVSGKKAFIIEAFLFHQFAELVGGEA